MSVDAGYEDKVVDLLLERLGGRYEDRERIAAAVATLNPNRPRAQALTDHLVARPDALRSARSDGPQAWVRLSRMLAVEFPNEVTAATCVRCGRSGELLRLLDGQRACGNCHRVANLKQCVRCGRDGVAIRRVAGGVLCSRCANRDHERDERCARCGKIARVASRTDGVPRCSVCTPRPLYTCSSCHRPNLPAQKMTDRGPICSTCYHRQHTARCSSCSTVSPYVRLRVDTNTWLCFSCWDPPRIACTRCGQLRKIKRCRRGTPVCESCRRKARPKSVCVECGRLRHVHSRLRMGNVCTGCYSRLRFYPEPCADCGESRALIGRNAVGARICGPCAGETRSWICKRCGRFAVLYADGNCPQCVARQRVSERFSDHTGQIHPQLQPLADALDVEGNPRSVIMWLHASSWSRLLGELAHSHELITHDILDELPQTRHLLYLRQVLVHTGVLQQRDEDIEGTVPWLDELLDRQSPAVSAIVRPYATWWVLRRARRRSQVNDNRAARKYARSRIMHAIRFLNGLEREGRTLQDATQADIDAWLADGGISRHRLRDFIVWAHGRQLCGPLEVPWLGRGEPNDFLEEQTRWALLRRCVHGQNLGLVQRLAGALTLLYGLTPTQIVQLTVADIERHEDRTFIRLGRCPVVLPDSVANIVAQVADQALDHRHSIVGTQSIGSPWLFPGAAPGQHARASWISEQLNRDVGLSVRRARNTALCSLAGDLAAPVLADLLDMHITTATRWTKLVKRDWSQYVSERTTEDRHLDGRTRPSQR